MLSFLLNLPPELEAPLDALVEKERLEHFKIKSQKKPVKLPEEVLRRAQTIANTQGLQSGNAFLRAEEKKLKLAAQLDGRLAVNRTPSRTSVIVALLAKALQNHNGHK